MSEQYEPSYYEIALTGRQVLVAFVILLVCLVAAFFSGVWVGRGGPGGAGTAAAAEATVAQGSAEAGTGPAAGEAQAKPGDDKSAPEEEGVDALSFFDQEAEGGGSSGGEPAAKTEPKPAEPPAAQASETPASAPPKEAAGGGEEASPPEAAKPSTAGAAAPPEHPRETANPSGALSGGDVVIQVFSSSDEAKAKEILDRLKANDFRAFISPVTDDGRTLFRVRVGPFEHPEDAERVAAELRRRLDLDTWITH